MKNLIIVSFYCLTNSGCIGFGAGTHGSIKGYRYPVKKLALQKAVEAVISSSVIIHRDTPKYNIVLVDAGKKDTLWDNYYNDTNNYVTFFIKNNTGTYEYIFRYYGGEEYWDTSKSSEIFIAYAYDEKRRGGSSGNGGVKWFNFSLRNKLTKPFEQEFINKIDSLLGVAHKEE